jgi:chorismate lyase / 3-hydroxybenzoate synthase
MAAQELQIYTAKAGEVAAAHAENLLGSMRFGLQPIAEPLDVCQQVLVSPLHVPVAWCEEVWLSKQPVQRLQEPGLVCHHNGEIALGVIEVPELSASAPGMRPLELAAEQAYKTLFAFIDKLGYHHLWRTWNYMADINLVTNGLERYQQFNVGRQHGFAASARHVTGNVPAACAIGTRSGPLSLAFIAGRVPTVAVENPRQVSAYHYPEQYGPRSPTFSRASLARVGQQELLLLSGTASIVGHQTLHHGDVRRQTLEVLTNIDAVLAQASDYSKAKQAYRTQDMLLRVYVRHATDYAAVKEVLTEQLGDGLDAMYLHADICRSDLDVEIEGLAWQNLRNTP